MADDADDEVFCTAKLLDERGVVHVRLDRAARAGEVGLAGKDGDKLFHADSCRVGERRLPREGEGEGEGEGKEWCGNYRRQTPNNSIVTNCHDKTWRR